MERKRKNTGQNIIMNIGLFWDRDKVCWAQKKGTGPKGLIGIQENAKGNGNVDFWKQQGVYALYHDYKLIYVGQVGLNNNNGCLGDRLKRHLSDPWADRWEKFSWFGFRKVMRNGELRQLGEIRLTKWNHLADVLEGIVIDIAEPPMNGQKGRFGKRVKRYLQDEARSQENNKNELKTIKEKIETVHKNIDKLLKEGRKKITRKIKSAKIQKVYKSAKGLVKKGKKKIYATYKNREYSAFLFPSGTITFKGKPYDSPSGAGFAAKGGKATNGWTFWKYKAENGQLLPLDNLRK